MPQSTLACEGADQVRRDVFGQEIGRWSFAPMCQHAQCEGSDFVRRDFRNVELARWSMAPQCSTVRCEGADWVRRDSRGYEIARWVNASYCPVQPVRLTQDPKPVRFGLSARG
jgi:hypothetical protein